MTSSLLAFDNLYSGKTWLGPSVVSIDRNGVIEWIRQGRAGGQGVRIQGWAVPGMPNCHSHAFQRAIAGATGHCGRSPDSFWSWRQAMYQSLIDLGPDDFEAITRDAFQTMLKAGYTSVAEFHYVHHDRDGRHYSDPAELSHRVIRAAENAGIRLLLLPVFYNRSGFGAQSVETHQRRFQHSLDSYEKLLTRLADSVKNSPNASLGIAPHSLRAASKGELKELKAMSDESGTPWHLHIAEQQGEVDACREYYNARPVEWLLNTIGADSRSCLIHATHVNDSELEAIAESQAVVGLCPTTEADLGDGVFPARRFQQIGGRFAIGSDSNCRIDVAEELRLLEWGQRLQHQRRNILRSDREQVGEGLYTSASIGGAQALGQRAGELTPGSMADFVVLDPQGPMLQGCSEEEVFDRMIFAASPGQVREVWVGGVRKVADGRLLDD